MRERGKGREKVGDVVGYDRAGKVIMENQRSGRERDELYQEYTQDDAGTITYCCGRGDYGEK